MRKEKTKKRSWMKRFFAWFLGIFVILLGEGGLLLLFLLRVDTMTLWPMIPDAKNHLELLQTTGAMVEILEHLPMEGETETAGDLAAALSVVGVSQLTLGASSSGDEEAEAITRYTMGLLRANLLRNQGELDEFTYEFLKIPFKTGSPKVMELTREWLYEKVNMGEKWEEDLERMTEKNGENELGTAESEAQEQTESPESELQTYKEEHVYGCYYLPGNFHDYLEISGLPDGTDRIRFIFESKEENQMMEQTFRYQIGKDDYRSRPGKKEGYWVDDRRAMSGETAGYPWMTEGVMLYDNGIRAEFRWEDDNTIRLTEGGWHWEDLYVKPKEGDFIFPDSHRRKLTEEEASALSGEERRIARNEIYARYGYPFESPDLQEYFGRFPWYDRGEYEAEEFNQGTFNEAELWNIKLLQ